MSRHSSSRWTPSTRTETSRLFSQRSTPHSSHIQTAWNRWIDTIWNRIPRLSSLDRWPYFLARIYRDFVESRLRGSDISRLRGIDISRHRGIDIWRLRGIDIWRHSGIDILILSRIERSRRSSLDRYFRSCLDRWTDHLTLCITWSTDHVTLCITWLTSLCCGTTGCDIIKP